MFDRAHNITNPADEMLAYLEANQPGYQGLRRRAVIYKSGQSWVLHACVVEGIFKAKQLAPKEPSRDYSIAVLYEDWLTPKDLRGFIVQILHGTIQLGPYSLDTGNTHRPWNRERQPLANNYMPYAGYVWTSKFHDNVNSMNEVLLVPGQPYYPDLHEAVQDWLPFTIYHGSSDSRKGEINFLLPETRAYFTDIQARGDFVELQVGGAVANEHTLEVKGAWWDEKGIHHFSDKVRDGLCRLTIPSSVSRSDYILVDAEGTVYDYQKEDVYRHTGLGRNRDVDGSKTLANPVTKALYSGEGKYTEFKPFIYPNISKDNDKAMEIVKTVAAFANTQGGRIFIGITNETEPVGINDSLYKWAKEKDINNSEACEKYLSAIKTLVPDQLLGDVKLNLQQTNWEGRTIVVIEVAEAQEKPVTLKRERNCLYVRRGANSVKATPEEWKGIVNSRPAGTENFFQGPQ